MFKGIKRTHVLIIIEHEFCVKGNNWLGNNWPGINFQCNIVNEIIDHVIIEHIHKYFEISS